MQEAPKTPKEHAVFRCLKEKARQHDTNHPRIIFICSDQSPALSSIVHPGGPRIDDAVYASFSETKSISGAVVLKIEHVSNFLGRLERRANGRFFVNQRARHQLTEDQALMLSNLNFNRWKYSFSLGKFERSNNYNDRFRRETGTLSMTMHKDRVTLEIPEKTLVDSLAGRTNLIKECGGEKNERLLHYLSEGWTIRSCSMRDADIQNGEGSKVILELVPPPEKVFWPK